jgi:hypothetical protein
MAAKIRFFEVIGVWKNKMKQVINFKKVKIDP